MRCFVAVTVGEVITEAVAAQLSRLQADAKRCGLRVSWSRPEGWHATLKFLGEIGQERAEAVRRRLARVAPEAEPFPVEATGLVTLPDGARVPNVVAVELSDDGRFSRLAGDVDEALADEGFERETRRFRPHLTIGRVRGTRGWRRFATMLEPLRARGLGAGEVRTMVLYRSRLGDGPARYEPIESYGLGAA